jgi:hypothetical protein
VQPGFAELVPNERVAVGFRLAAQTANGLLVRLDTLDAERAFEEAGEAVVRSSAPRVSGGAAKFSVDRAGTELVGARTLADGSVLGFAGADLVRLRGGAKAVLFAVQAPKSSPIRAAPRAPPARSSRSAAAGSPVRCSTAGWRPTVAPRARSSR